MNPTPDDASVRDVGRIGDGLPPREPNALLLGASGGASSVMLLLRRHALAYALFVGFGVIALACGALAWERWHKAVEYQRELKRADAELRELLIVTPPLSRQTTGALEEELSASLLMADELREKLTALKQTTNRVEPASKIIERADAYFEIAAFIERMREQATKHGVQLETDERFGFADFAHKGPEPDDIPMVLRERMATESLLNALFHARPQQILAVQRERRVEDAARAASRIPVNSASVGKDYFPWDARVSAGLPGLTVASALRVSFVGQTVSLRTLLGELGKFELPLFVRSVEVEPMALKLEGRKLEGLGSEASTPLVSQSRSRFAVTVEWIEWTDLVNAPST